MSEQKWTPEPWRVDGDSIWHEGKSYRDENDPHLYTGIQADRSLRDSPPARAGLHRATACVNALACIDDPAAFMAEVREVLGECENYLSNRGDMDEDTDIGRMRRAIDALLAQLPGDC